MKETFDSTTEIATESTTKAISEITATKKIVELTSKSVIEQEDSQTLYYVSKSGKKYHLGDCYNIDVDKCTTLTLEEIKKLGYEPCKICKPDK